MTGGSDNLVGSWQSDLDDLFTRKQIGKVRIEFYSDQTLAYITFENEKMQVIKLTYKISGNMIVTDQPSHPDIQETRFELRGRSLKLFYGPEPAVFKKLG